MTKEIFSNAYFTVVFTNIRGVFKDYDLYVDHTLYGTYYTLKEVFLTMKGVYDEKFN